ncbi:histidine kinase [Nostoc sp. CALU 546]|uniref:histidine kinase n=1 Tax=Nostoc sp. CALU 546 TaxID=1867241 RepID=UPI003B6773DA
MGTGEEAGEQGSRGAGGEEPILNTSQREAAPTALLSTSAQCPMPNAQCPCPMPNP